MAYSESLALRLRQIVASRRGVAEKKMFGGVGFLLRGNMLCGVWNQSLIVRVGPAAYDAALAEEHVREFDLTGRPMRGWIFVDPDGIETDQQLTRWVELALDFAGKLPAKSNTPREKKMPRRKKAPSP